MILHILNVALIFAEEIDNKGFWAAADLAYQLLEIIIGIDGQDGPEDLFLHNETIFLRFFENCWREVKLIFYNFAPIE